jgi:hypothetical protein
MKTIENREVIGGQRPLIFQISFTGRERGAIGTFYPISFTLEIEESEINESGNAATAMGVHRGIHPLIVNKIYEKYEHVQFLKATEVTE